MRKLKKGTFLALDKNTKNIYVGGHIKDADGFVYKIDNYGRAVKNEDKSLHDIKDLKDVEVYTAPDADAAAGPKKTRAPRKPKSVSATTEAPHGESTEGPDPAKTTVTQAPDQMLADELRARGYKLTAKKTVNIKL